MPKKNSAPQPIGKGKAGTGKRMIYEAGGGKKALAKWRAMPKSARKVIKKTSKTVGDFDILDTIKRNPSRPMLAKKGTPASKPIGPAGGAVGTLGSGAVVGKRQKGTPKTGPITNTSVAVIPKTGPNARTRKVAKVAKKVMARRIGPLTPGPSKTAKGYRAKAREIIKGRK